MSLLFTAPKITVKQLRAWMNRHKIAQRELAKTMGLAEGSLCQLLYYGEDPDSKIVPPAQTTRLVGIQVMSGLPGLFDIQLIDRQVAVRLAEGFRRSSIAKKDRTIEDANLIGYSIRIMESLLDDHKYELQDVASNATVQLQSDGQGGSNGQCKNDGSVQDGAPVSPGIG